MCNYTKINSTEICADSIADCFHIKVFIFIKFCYIYPYTYHLEVIWPLNGSNSSKESCHYRLLFLRIQYRSFQFFNAVSNFSYHTAGLKELHQISLKIKINSISTRKCLRILTVCIQFKLVSIWVMRTNKLVMCIVLQRYQWCTTTGTRKIWSWRNHT